jgi:glycosyltransferase involved in cell wall biosynthesis
MQDERRVAIFQAEWPVQSQVANAVIMLAEAGYQVELFLFNTWTYVELETFSEKKGVQVHNIIADGRPTSGSENDNNVPRRHSFKRGVKTFLRTRFPPLNSVDTHVRAALQKAHDAYKLLSGSEEGLLPQEIVARALELMAGKNYCCLIGVEKKGLIWAGRIAERLQVRFLYYSLELYTEDFRRLVMRGSPDFRRLRSAERRYHRKASATIIQDSDRAGVLFKDNGLSMSEATIFYVPVSVLGDPYKRRSWLLHETLGLPRDRKIILYIGQIWEKRYVLELTKVAQSFPEDWVLVMHGEDYDSAVEKIKALDLRKRVILSLQMVPSDRLREVVASAEVGLAFYSQLIQNDRLTAFSSEKMALYMQCGVPFIAFDYLGYRRLADVEECGLVIGGLHELPEAIHRILRSHEEFRQRAYHTFVKYYDFATNFAKVVEGLRGLP